MPEKEKKGNDCDEVSDQHRIEPFRHAVLHNAVLHNKEALLFQ